MMNNYKIEVSYNKKEYNQLEYDNIKGEYSNGTLCDKDGYVYDIDINGQKYIKEEFLFENGKYSDGTLCDKDGYVYDVDIFGYKYKLYEEIEIQTCDKTVLTLDIKIDGIDNCPNYYLSNIDEGLICKKKWNELEVYIDRNHSRESRNLSFYIHHNISGETKRKITINQIGDVCAIDKTANYFEYSCLYDVNEKGKRYQLIDINGNVKEYNKDEYGNYYYKEGKIPCDKDGYVCKKAFWTTYQYQPKEINNNKPTINIQLKEYPHLTSNIEYEKFKIKFNVIGGSSSIFVKNIEQYIITTKAEYIKIYDINTNRLFNINKKGEKYQLTDINGNVKEYNKDEYGNYYYKEGKIPCNKDGYVYVTYIDDGGENKYITYEEYKKYINNYNSNNTTTIKNILDNYFYEGFIENKINENSIDINNIIPSLGTIISVEESDFIKKTYKRQYILRYFDENGYFETSPERLIFYDEIGEAVILDIIKDNVMIENQITNNYSYLPIKQFEEINYYEKIEYDRALNTKIENNNILEITSYGRLYLKGDDCYYRLIIAHKNDYSKTFDLYIDFSNKTEDTNNEVAQVYSLKSIGNNLFNETLETIQLTNKKGVYKLLVKRNFLNGIDIEWEEYNDWIQTKIVNDYIYFTYNNNVYNKQRSNIAIIKVGNNFYKKIQFTQEPYFDYKIDSKFNFYELKYNESPFNIMVNVYGGDKKLIVDNNFPYKYEIVEYYRSVYFNTYMIIIKPSLNNEHKYIESTLILKHYSDNNIVKQINFKQGLNLNTIEYTILCDNLILLNSTTTMYYFDVETYPFDDSTISYENISRWLKVDIKEHRVYLTISPNNGKKRSTILKLTNNEFPFKQRFIKIIQKGTKI